ncbi:MAG: aminopeptidase P family protein [Caldilineaceae bacterium]|nr:aminopeptidase P family protein [Caldilineaceae bacterium]
MRLGVPFYQRKVQAVQQELANRKLAGLLTLHYAQICYLAGFFHYPNERPVGLFIPQQGDPSLFIPRLEMDYVHEGGWAPDVECYTEYPGLVHPVEWICQRLAARGFENARLGWEESLSVGMYERLAHSLPQVEWVKAGDIVANLRLVKEPEEIELMQRAAGYADWMVEEGVRLVRTGGRPSEIELEQAMVRGVIHKMQAELDPVVAVPGLAGALVCSGPRSAFPHGLPTARRIAAGENLILSVACFVGGYFAESERTFILGEPSADQRHRYETDRLAQQVGTQALVTGMRCGEANRRCLDVIRAAGLGDYIRHRQGHGIGIQNHEPPWIEDGDDTLLQPGMAVSCEPGVYCPGQGGYRISDSVVITDEGPQLLTHFPRDLDSIVIDLP